MTGFRINFDRCKTYRTLGQRTVEIARHSSTRNEFRGRVDEYFCIWDATGRTVVARDSYDRQPQPLDPYDLVKEVEEPATRLEARDQAAATMQKAPRVTLDQIKTLIAGEKFFVDDTLTICVLTLTNGYKVTGESAAADPANFNPDLGRKIAKEKATAEIWPLAGFLLRDRLHRDDHPAVMRCKVVMASRQHAYANAPLNSEGKPPGRHHERPWSFKDAGGVEHSGIGYDPDPPDPTNIRLDGEMVDFYAVCPPTCDPKGAPENLIFGEMTPNFRLSAHVRNRAVLAQLQQGASYYVDFTPAD